MIEKEIKIYQSVNEKKGIISVNFYNPVTGRKTTKSLGKEIGLDDDKAREIIEQLNKLINNKEYYRDYTGYLDAKRDFINEMVINMVFSGADFLKIKNEEERMKYIDNKIPILDEIKTYRGKAIQLLGDSGAGKTKTIQHLLGSVEHNTPASTTSNTTVSDFEAVIDGSAKTLKMVVCFLNKEELEEYIKDNVLKCIKIVLSMNGNEELNNTITNNLMVSDDMKLRLNILLRSIDKNNEKLINIQNILMKRSGEIWGKFTQDKKVILNYKDASKEIKCEFSEYLEEERDRISEECLKILMQVIVGEMNKIINRMGAIINDSMHEQEYACISEIVTNLDKYDNTENLELSESNWPKYFYFEVNRKESGIKPDKVDRDFFWKVYRNISCADEKTPNLYPLVAASRIEGNFKPLWLTENEIEKAVIIDTEGFGHDVDKLVFSSKTIKFMQNVDQILWIINSTRSMTNNDKLILEELLRNGCINKMKMCFNRLEKMDKDAEKSDDAKQTRIDLLINNLFKYFEERQYESSVDAYSYKENIIKRDKRYYFDYLDEIIKDENGIWTTETESLIMKLKLNKDDCSQLKTPVNYTIKSFKQIIDWINSEQKDQKEDIVIEYSPIYSSSVLSRLCDSSIINYKADIKKKIGDAHWNTVRAFTSRMYYNSPNYRGWGGMYPENELKMIIKDIVLNYLMKPHNYNVCEESNKVAFREKIQYAQNDLAKKIDNFVEKKVSEDIKEKWKIALEFYGPGSGLKRKEAVIDIFNEIFKFEEQKQEKNMVYVELYETIKQNETLKELNTKIEI